MTTLPKNTVFVLGSGDIEMETIEALVNQRGFVSSRAMKYEEYVNPRNAYEADPEEVYGCPVVLVECEPVNHAELNVIARCDHHRPGDAGFDCGPDDFMNGSSLGQVMKLLSGGEFEFKNLQWYLNGEVVDRRLVAIAAGDHCLGHAYAHRCDGISPEEILEIRVEEKALFRAANADDIMEEIKASIRIIRELPAVTVGGWKFADARRMNISELPEASAFTGTAVMYSRLDPRENRVKVGVLNGEKESLEAWMKWAEDNPELEGVYGNPTRGYAGAYQVGS